MRAVSLKCRWCVLVQSWRIDVGIEWDAQPSLLMFMKEDGWSFVKFWKSLGLFVDGRCRKLPLQGFSAASGEVNF